MERVGSGRERGDRQTDKDSETDIQTKMDWDTETCMS